MTSNKLDSLLLVIHNLLLLLQTPSLQQHHLGSYGLHAEDSRLVNLLRDFMEHINDLLLQLVHAGMGL